MCDIESIGFSSLIPSVCSTDTSLLPPLLPFVQLIIYNFLATWINTELFSCTVPRLVHEISDEHLCSPCLYCCNYSVPDALLCEYTYEAIEFVILAIKPNTLGLLYFGFENCDLF